MELIPERLVEPLQWFSNDWKERLKPELADDAAVVQKGLILYRQGSVIQLKLEKDEIVTGIVQDVTPAKIKLDLNIPYLSECSCPGDGICRHQMAAFFHLLSRGNSVSAWVEAWRQPLREQKQAQTLHIGRAKDLLKGKGPAEPNYENWTHSFRESFDLLMNGNGDPKPYLINELYSVYERRVVAAAPLEMEWRNLYMLVARVVSFQKLLRLSTELEHDETIINHHYRHLFQNILDDTEQLTYKLSVQSRPFAFDQFIEKLKDETAQLLTEEASVDFERIHLFRRLWTDLFKNRTWREEMAAQLTQHASLQLSVKVGLIHLNILLGNDEEVKEEILACDANITPYFFYWFDLFNAKQMEFYIHHFIGLMKDYLSAHGTYFGSRQFMHMALRAIGPYCTEHNRPDLLERAYIHTLPYSFYDYQDFLFEKKEYQKWMELQTYNGFTFESLSKDTLKTLQTEAPEILLPLYHQGIQADLDGKNRASYRQAVRKLKKLRTLYKKVKRLDEWEQYFDLLLFRTKRMRAFQEECKRGKLIDA
ncbi:SWIM zinc finger family protein [Niallia sp. XMNu-256]|uniref:SWIM zinc finger family protein n=1 Tax=Niallia sp. XMNu-256 TaxID=3082444 RepID=UPI0030CD4AC7